MNHDEKLKEAMESIKKILRDYEIAGSVVLVSKTHSEFLYEFPVWSAIQWNEDRDGLRLTSRKRDFKTEEEWRENLQQSVHIIAQNRDLAGQSFIVFNDTFERLEEQMEIMHKPFSGFEPHSKK